MTDFETRVLDELRDLKLSVQRVHDRLGSHLEAHAVYDAAKARRHDWIKWLLGPMLATLVTVAVARWVR